MNRIVTVVIAAAICALTAFSCSNGAGPASPSINPDLSAAVKDTADRSTVLWGYYDVYIDISTQTATAVPNRQVMFTANVVNFLNSKTTNLGFHINSTPVGPDYVDVDIDVSITHPFPGLSQYNGYDVRGIFMGDGELSMAYDPDLTYAQPGVDQILAVPDPFTTEANQNAGWSDGCSRWFNRTEFFEGGAPLFQYTQGKLATPGYVPTATINAYKYYADGLGTDESLYSWLIVNGATHGVFSAGSTNTRNYYLRFPNTLGVKYAYAVIADWLGTDPSQHPSNAADAVACSVSVTDSVYFASPTDKGGDLILDLSVFDWHSQPSAGLMEDYRIFIQSTVLNNVYECNTTDMTPIGGGDNYYTYYVDIPADNIQGTDGNEFWVIVQYPGHDYSNEFGADNLTGGDPLAAFFRYNLNVMAGPNNYAPICDLQVVTPLPVQDWDIGTVDLAVEFDASGSTDKDGDPLTYEWDFDGDGVYGEASDDSYTGPQATPTHHYGASYNGKVYVRVSDNKGGHAVCSVDVTVIAHPTKNIPLRLGVAANDIAVDSSNGDVLIIYSDQKVFKYLASDFYVEAPAEFYTFISGPQRVYVAPNHYSMASPLPNSGTILVYDPSGVAVGPFGWGISCQDIWFFNDGGVWAGDAVTLYGYWNEALWGHGSFLYRAPDPTFPTWTQHQIIYWNVTEPQIGRDQMEAVYLRGAQPDNSGDTFWIIKDPYDPLVQDYYISRWLLDAGGGIDFNDAYYGTGSRDESDLGWYHAMDLTRDPSDHLLVLDQLSNGKGRIKAFTGDSSGGTSLGGVDLPDTVSATPIRMDANDWVDPTYGNLIFVLHGDGIAGYYMSIFFPSELPW